MTGRHHCPVCRAQTLTIREGVAGTFIWCARGCPRQAIVEALGESTAHQHVLVELKLEGER